MNRKLRKQIKAYAGVAGTILGAEKLNAQVVYVDINPDTLVVATPCDSLTYFNIDIDNDSAIDFNFIIKSACVSTWNSFFLKVHPYSNNKINNALYHYGWWTGSSNTQFALNPMKLNCGDTINQNGAWLSSEKFLFSSEQGSMSTDIKWQGAWLPVSDNYLPFLLFKNSNNYYGWMHIKVVNRFSFLLKEYAYQILPNVPVIACDTTNLATGISQPNHLQFSFSQQNNSLHISSFQKFNHANILVYDLLGKEMLQQSFEGKETTFTIDKKGIYFVEVKSEKGIFRKKVFIY